MVASDFKWFLSLSLLKCSKSQLASHHHIKFSYMPFALYLVTFLERNRMAATGKLNGCGGICLRWVCHSDFTFVYTIPIILLIYNTILYAHKNEICVYLCKFFRVENLIVLFLLAMCFVHCLDIEALNFMHILSAFHSVQMCVCVCGYTGIWITNTWKIQMAQVVKCIEWVR